MRGQYSEELTLNSLELTDQFNSTMVSAAAWGQAQRDSERNKDFNYDVKKS